jgi:glycosyltransferase involved in cell wall biosynthesis
MSQASAPRIAFLYPDKNPTAAENWSGTPLGLSEGLRMCGVDVIPIGLRLPSPLRYSVAVMSRSGGRRRATAHRAPAYIAARTVALAREVRRMGALSGIVALGTDYYDLERVVGAQAPVATYDDGTFALFAKHKDSDLRLMGYPIEEVDRWIDLQARACRRANACCASTQWAARSLIEDYAIPEERVHVVGMGHRPRATATVKDWSVPRLLFVGVDWQRKNGEAVVRAFDRFRSYQPDATLDLVGEHPPIKVAGVTGHGLLPRNDRDAQDKLDTLYAQSTMFVLPSRFDPSPIAYLEAASAGLPVIATTEGGAGELLGSAAVTVHPDDDDGLLGAMRRLSDPGIAQLMGNEGALSRSSSRYATRTAAARSYGRST